MPHRVLSVGGALCAAVWLLAAPIALTASAAIAQAAEVKPTDKSSPPPPPQEGGKPDEYSEAQHVLSGAAGNPECVWLGRRVVNLLWRDDIETAFRHLDLYDRFGCPAGHIQATFRCLILHAASIDPKAPDSLNGRVQACWLNPTQPTAAAPAAAGPSPTH